MLIILKINNIRETGYSSYHLIVKPKDSNKLVEIQIRTKSQHYWATLVEITDLVFGVKLKEGQEHPELFKFHKLLAKKRDQELVIDEMEELISLEKKHEIFSKLITLFTSNYCNAIIKWINSLSESSNEYLIMQLDKEFSPSFNFYPSFEEAESNYFDKFTHEEPNMVLIHMNNPNFEKLDLAYSNYVLTSHPSIKNYFNVLRLIIKEKRKEGYLKRKEEDNLKSYHDKLLKMMLESFTTEIELYQKKIDETDNSFKDEKIHQWVKSLGNRLINIQTEKDDFENEYSKIEPKTPFDSIINILTLKRP